ncbi:MAG: hypothetical protein JXA69_18085 [Phycisphaerae bacterium]|nr:hypothetical protein [Phycisphaerae bacterium]
MRRAPHPITVAAGQLVAKPLRDARDTLAAIERLIEQAAMRHAGLVVLPECAYPAYGIGSVEAYRAVACVPNDAFMAHLRTLARRWRLCIVSGFVEDTPDGLANAAVLIDADGREVGRHRKTFLWDQGNVWFRRGERLQVFDTTIGRIGMVICAEARCPEVVATLAAQGAELIAMPTCWINTPTDSMPFNNPQVEFMIEARVREFGIPFVCANKSGSDGPGFSYCGRSLIVDADARRTAEAPPTGEAIVVSSVTASPPRRSWIPSSRRPVLTGQVEAARPPADAPPVIVAVVPGGVADEMLSDTTGEALFGPLRRQGVQLVLTNVQYEAMADAIVSIGRGFGIETVAFPARSDVYTIGVPVGVRMFRGACVGGQAIQTFASARSLALSGAAALLVFDAPSDLAVLRTRAAENRVFVLAVADAWAAVIAPDGAVLAETAANPPAPLVVKIEPAKAAEKAVAPLTDIFEERATAAFRF